MNEREKNLVKIIGTVVICYVLWTGYSRYRNAIKTRQNQIASLQEQQQQLFEQQLQGEYANRQMGEYLVRSLSSDPEQAQSEYQQWLLQVVSKQIEKPSVDANSSRAIGGLYQLIDYRVSGTAELPELIGLLHEFYAKDYLHRIRDLSVRPSKTGGFALDMSVDVIALLSAPDELPERSEPSWRVDGDTESYVNAIMDRNLYEPPNQAPKYSGSSSIEAILGRDTPSPLAFKDAEGHSLNFEFVEEPPEFVRLDPRSGTLRVNASEKQEFDLVVRATDNGYPRRTTEQRIKIRVVDPPPPPVEAPPKLAFDDATQTVLTALVQGRNEWTAWMHVRTRDKTLRLKVGDGFEIGSLKGSVVEVTPRYVTLEIDGRRFELKPAGNLSEAAKRSEVD
ncbi:MAG: cadherin repeat domain-containing protein [Rubripirellula sp.]